MAASSPAADPSHQEFAAPVLGEPRRHTNVEVADTVGVPTDRARRYWRALGYAAVADTAVEFTESDVAALRMLVGFVEEGLVAERNSLQLSRLVGRAVARLVESQVEVVVSRLEEAGVDAEERIEYLRQVAHRVMPDVQWLLGHTWRRHMAAAIHRLNPDVDDAQPTLLGVGFADMVGFTNLSRQLSDAGIMHLVERFEDHAAEVIAECGGKVVKMLGDEVLFTAGDPESVAAIGTRLAAGTDRNPDMPGLRVGMALGPVVRHFGDVFGTTVNLASRLTALTEPNTVLIAPTLATALAGNPSYELTPAGVRYVRGIGPVTPDILTRRSRPVR